jgi:hypothetical protein
MSDLERLLENRWRMVEHLRSLSAPVTIAMDPFAVLGIAQGSTETEIRCAHLRLSQAALDRQDGVWFDDLADACDELLARLLPCDVRGRAISAN